MFPEGTALSDAHRVATRIEQMLEASLNPRAHVTTHLESASDHDELHPQEREVSPPRMPS